MGSIPSRIPGADSQQPNDAACPCLPSLGVKRRKSEAAVHALKPRTATGARKTKKTPAEKDAAHRNAAAEFTKTRAKYATATPLAAIPERLVRLDDADGAGADPNSSTASRLHLPVDADRSVKSVSFDDASIASTRREIDGSTRRRRRRHDSTSIKPEDSASNAAAGGEAGAQPASGTRIHELAMKAKRKLGRKKGEEEEGEEEEEEEDPARGIVLKGDQLQRLQSRQSRRLEIQRRHRRTLASASGLSRRLLTSGKVTPAETAPRFSNTRDSAPRMERNETASEEDDAGDRTATFGVAAAAAASADAASAAASGVTTESSSPMEETSVAMTTATTTTTVIDDDEDDEVTTTPTQTETMTMTPMNDDDEDDGKKTTTTTTTTTTVIDDDEDDEEKATTLMPQLTATSTTSGVYETTPIPLTQDGVAPTTPENEKEAEENRRDSVAGTNNLSDSMEPRLNDGAVPHQSNSTLRDSGSISDYDVSKVRGSIPDRLGNTPSPVHSTNPNFDNHDGDASNAANTASNAANTASTAANTASNAANTASYGANTATADASLEDSTASSENLSRRDSIPSDEEKNLEEEGTKLPLVEDFETKRKKEKNIEDRKMNEVEDGKEMNDQESQDGTNFYVNGANANAEDAEVNFDAKADHANMNADAFRDPKDISDSSPKNIMTLSENEVSKPDANVKELNDSNPNVDNNETNDADAKFGAIVSECHANAIASDANGAETNSNVSECDANANANYANFASTKTNSETISGLEISNLKTRVESNIIRSLTHDLPDVIEDSVSSLMKNEEINNNKKDDESATLALPLPPTPQSTRNGISTPSESISAPR